MLQRMPAASNCASSLGAVIAGLCAPLLYILASRCRCASRDVVVSSSPRPCPAIAAHTMRRACWTIWFGCVSWFAAATSLARRCSVAASLLFCACLFILLCPLRTVGGFSWSVSAFRTIYFLLMLCEGFLLRCGMSCTFAIFHL